MQIQKSTGTEDVVVDTNALVALIDEKDKWHKPALAIYQKLRNGNYMPIYFDCVVNETIGVLGRRTTEQKRFADFSNALSTLKNQVPQHAITWASIETKRLYSDIIDLVSESEGELNFHDALIARYCQEAGFGRIFSFDTDFDRIKWLTRIADESDL